MVVADSRSIHTMKEESVHKLPAGFSTAKVRTAFEAVLSRAAKSKENTLFSDTATRFLLDVTSHRIPDGDNHFFNIVLPHPPHPPSSDILLVIPDDLKNEADPDIVVNQMKDRLREAGVKIREVMTLKQCKDEYSTFEAKRALAKRIDIVVGDLRVFKCLSSILGREFYKKKKFALALDFEKSGENLAEALDYVLKKTVFNISTKGPTSAIVVGHDHLNVGELVENVCKISNWIMRSYPGGWNNVAKLSIYSTGVPPLVVYYSQGTRNDVSKAVTRGGALPPPEEDELSTIPGSRVRVHARGDIEVIKEDLDESDEEIILSLGVEKEAKDETYGRKKGEKGPKVDVEENYLDSVLKTQAFEELGKKRKNKGSHNEDGVPKKKKAGKLPVIGQNKFQKGEQPKKKEDKVEKNGELKKSKKKEGKPEKNGEQKKQRKIKAVK